MNKEIKVILLDIEGTTTDISFVKNELFPYASEHVEEFLNQHIEDQEIRNIAKHFSDNQEELCIKSIVTNVRRQIKEDQKTTELKNLQGKIWKVAFESGSIKGHVYDDVPKNLKKWVEKGIKIYIYSSGSVEAQKLLFAHSTHGCLSNYLSGYFDTKIGHKQETQSYENIIKEIKIPANEILFLSDIPNESIAAKKAGMDVVIIERSNNPAKISEDIKNQFKTACDFGEIMF